ncbi:KTSC domain-containing protein [Sphingomonas lacunae]|uniref:KTSC domain-containing protein n=1 Tax=Sphingomonas lacunae TaxID=2698828 RepID=A0A6M4ASD8_9SPHN|nr:KTSC domain-containing protein [Sphingomonas lacunae]
MHYFSSTAIRAASYDVSTRVLSLQFTSAVKWYDYPGVPRHIYQGLLDATSKGTYFNRYIRDQYSVAV